MADVLPFAIVLKLLTSLSDPAVLAVTSFAVLLGSVVLQNLGWRSPGKAIFALRINGQGCISCRELRRLWPLLLIGFGALICEVTGLGTPLFAVGLGAVLSLPTHILPLLRGDVDMPYDRATGFRVLRDKPD